MRAKNSTSSSPASVISWATALGQWFGSRENAVVYLASALIVVALVSVTILAVCEPTLRADAMKGAFALMALIAGYMLGHAVPKQN